MIKIKQPKRYDLRRGGLVENPTGYYVRYNSYAWVEALLLGLARNVDAGIVPRGNCSNAIKRLIEKGKRW